MEPAIALVLGALLGVLLGLLGGGGSILAVPALVYGLGLEFRQVQTLKQRPGPSFEVQILSSSEEWICQRLQFLQL